jgi:putative ABC transport system permease protein
MLLTNIKVYLKFLSRNRVYTAINFVGFSAALVFVILLGLYVAGESRVDRFHEKGERIFRLTDGEGYFRWPALVAGDLAGRYPEIESFVRHGGGNRVVSRGAGNEKFRAKMMAVDSTFFSVFSFPLAAGDPARQLQTAGDVTLSESFAVRLFGAEDPIGKPLVIDGDPHTVTGVVRDFEDSHFENPDIIVRFDGAHLNPVYFGEYGYRAWNFSVYLLARENADPAAKADDMTEFLRTNVELLDTGEEVALEPLAESYFNSRNIYAAESYRAGSRQFIGLLAAAVMAILLFAVINYVNLSVALGGFRAKEAAMRRLLGGTRGGLLRGYVFESVIFCFMAVVIAVVLAGIVEPYFNNVLGSEVSIVEALKNPAVIAVLIGAALVLGVVSGIYPALVVTRVKPIEVVKGEFTRKIRMTYSRIFIGLQFCLTMVLIGCALTIERQTRFMRTTDLGFDKENLLYLENVTENNGLPGLRDKLMAVPGVEMVSFTAGTPYNGGNNNTSSADEWEFSAQIFEADSMFLSILGLEKISETDAVSDSKGMVAWLNETAVRELSSIPAEDHDGLVGTHAVAGTLRDFNINRLQRSVPPVIVRIYDLLGADGEGLYPWDILVKVSPGNPAETYRAVQAAYLDYNGGEPFDSGFVDAAIDDWYREQRRMGTLISGFSVLAIIISTMGLVAMTTYFMRQRRRDIAVRKVFGATNAQVLGRLVGNFMRIVAVAFVAAVPLVWWLMCGWLSSFAYRIPLGWTIFAAAGLSVGAVALAAVWWQSRMAARRNPVESLKSE